MVGGRCVCPTVEQSDKNRNCEQGKDEVSKMRLFVLVVAGYEEVASRWMCLRASVVVALNSCGTFWFSYIAGGGWWTAILK